VATSDPESAAKVTDELARAAEDEAAAADARAEAARARAEELRRRIAQADHADDAGEPDVAAVADEAETPPSADPVAPTSAPARSVPVLPAVVVGVAALLTIGLLGTTGYLFWQHQKDSRNRHIAAEFTAAARQDVINLMSIDYNSAQDSVQRVLDGSTGRFRSNFSESADDFVKALKDEKIVTRATVNDAAVESVTGDSAVVLVSATSHREGPKAPADQQQPRLWRVVVTLVREDGQIKMSGVDFV
jgi:Mce-associated membrane protein